MTVKLYEVGGYVRDELLGIKSKDIDFAVEASSWEELRWWLDLNNFEVFLETPQFFTIRARFPRAFGIGAWEKYRGLTADFVLCRKDGAYSDGRRPDEVTPGTIYDDLARRDFTVNAIARDVSTGELLDPWHGEEDLKVKWLRTVGRPEDRIREDPLRALRALRFAVTKDFRLDMDLLDVLRAYWLPSLLVRISEERRREELHKALHHNTFKTLNILQGLGQEFRDAALGDIWLKPTTEK